MEIEIAHGLGRIHEILATFQLTRETYLAIQQELERRRADPEMERLYQEEHNAHARWRSGSG